MFASTVGGFALVASVVISMVVALVIAPVLGTEPRSSSRCPPVCGSRGRPDVNEHACSPRTSQGAGAASRLPPADRRAGGDHARAHRSIRCRVLVGADRLDAGLHARRLGAPAAWPVDRPPRLGAGVRRRPPARCTRVRPSAHPSRRRPLGSLGFRPSHPRCVPPGSGGRNLLRRVCHLPPRQFGGGVGVAGDAAPVCRGVRRDSGTCSPAPIDHGPCSRRRARGSCCRGSWATRRRAAAPAGLRRSRGAGWMARRRCRISSASTSSR